MPGITGAGPGEYWLLLALAALVVVAGVTASAAAWRRMRRGANFAGGFVVGGAGLIGLGGVALLMLAGPERVQHAWQALPSWSAPPPLPNIVYPSRPVATTAPPAANTPGGNHLAGRVTHVRDGDTIVVERTPIRFTDVDCAEKGTPEGDRATEAMRRLASGQPVQCRLIGRRSYDREIGTCALPNGQDLGMTLVAQGLCVRRR